MKTKHTPGEWYVEKRTTEYEVTIYANPKTRIAEVKSFGFGFNDATLEEANARLIAAAPELLEALELVAGYSNAFNECPPKMKDFILSAIKKAKGE